MNDYDDGMAVLHLGHVLEVLPALPERSVHCVVTSPPYWGLRDYKVPATAWGGDPGHAHEWGDELPQDARHRYTEGKSGKHAPVAKARAYPAGRGSFCACGAWRGQLGLEPTPELYVEHVVEVFAQVRRVLRDDGTLWLNMGDCYSSNPKGPGGDAKSTLSPSGVKAQRAAHLSRPTAGRAYGLKPKDLVGMPWRVAFALQQAGWWLRKDIIWSKPNPMPESVYDRPTTAHEYLFLMAKSARYFYDAVAIQEPTTGNAHPRGDGLNPKALLSQVLERPVAWDESRGSHRELIAGHGRREPGRKQKVPAGWDTRPGSSHKELDGRYDKQAATGAANEALRGGDTYGGFNERWLATEPLALRNARSVWTIPTQPYPEAHFATFPEELPRRCILAGTSAKGACPECGAPWRRLMRTTYESVGPAATSGGDFAGGERGSGDLEHGRFRPQEMPYGRARRVDEQVAWVPGCGCGTGLAADAFELIGTPMAERDEGYKDPSLEVGRAGFARPRVEGEGLSWMTRHEQRQYAGQLRTPAPLRGLAQMRQEAGEAAFDHYARTDYPNGARAIPVDLLDAWLAVGWLWRAESPFDRLHLAPAPVPGTVMDPFAGSGTTLAVAKSLDRRSVGIDIGYAALSRRRVERAAAQVAMPEVL